MDTGIFRSFCRFSYCYIFAFLWIILIFSPWRLYPPESYPEKLRSQYFGIKDPSNSIETEVRKIIDGRQEIDEQIKGAAYY